MIDFQNGTYVKLRAVETGTLAGELTGLLTADERVQLAFKGVRDMVAFTNKRFLVVNVQGITGKKRDYTSLPLARIQAWSVETAGTFDLDSELELWFSGLGKVRLEFAGNVDIRQISQLIGEHVL